MEGSNRVKLQISMGLFNSLFISDVDPADVKGRLTVICHEQFIFVSHQG